MKRLHKLALVTSALVVGTVVTIALAIPSGVFADQAQSNLAIGVSGSLAPSQPVLASDQPDYQGWATVRQAPGTVCTLSFPSQCYTTSWVWTAYGWRQSARRVGTRVWVHPFAEGWSWTWTSTTGWQAMRSDTIVIRYDSPIVVT